MDEALAAAGVERERFLVQRMVEGGVELLVGVATDPVFGPVLACGAGGTQAELLGDVSVRVCPLGPDDAGEMIRSLAIFPLLTGFRGGAQADLDALGELLLRVSAMVDSPPRDRRARPQPGDRRRRRRAGGRRQDQGQGGRAGAALAAHLDLTARAVHQAPGVVAPNQMPGTGKAESIGGYCLRWIDRRAN